MRHGWRLNDPPVACDGPCAGRTGAVHAEQMTVDDPTLAIGQTSARSAVIDRRGRDRAPGRIGARDLAPREARRSSNRVRSRVATRSFVAGDFGGRLSHRMDAALAAALKPARPASCWALSAPTGATLLVVVVSTTSRHARVRSGQRRRTQTHAVLVRPAGKPPTSRSVVWRSIQLSYGRRVWGAGP